MYGTKKQILEFLKDKGEDILFKIEERRETRTQSQNRLYWKWLNDLIGEFENKGIFITAEDLHEGLRDKLIKGKYKRNLFTGRKKLHRKSTTELNKKEFSQYIKDVEVYLWQTFEVSHALPTDLFYNN